MGRSNPNVKIDTNAPSAIAQLSAVAAATKRLQDAQGAEAVAQAKLTDLRNKDGVSAGRMAAAEENVAKAHRATANAVVQLTNAYEQDAPALDRTAASAEKATFQSHALRDSFLLLGAAAVPVAAVAGGALLGLVPVAAAAYLGIAGIADMMKKGALQSTQYGTDITWLKNEFADLKQTAASGLLLGVDTAIKTSHPLFAALNKDIGGTSVQLGQIVAHAGPALVTVMNQLNPLFVSFGTLLTRGAIELEHWARTSTGVQSFVAYVQANLPTVASLFGNLTQLVSHLGQGVGLLGGSVLTDLNLFVHILNLIPVGVLQTAVPLALSLYAAFRAYSGINALLAPIPGMLEKIGVGAGAAALEVDAAGETAAVGWIGLLGPIGAVAVGIGLLTALFMSNKKAAQDNAAMEDTYSSSLRDNANALAASNIAVTTSNLQKQGAMRLADQLRASNTGLNVSYGEMATAVNGSAEGFNTLIARLNAVAKANSSVFAVNAAGDQYLKYNATGTAALNLAAKLTTLRGALTAEEKAQLAVSAAERQAQIITDGGNSAVARQARTLGVTADAYLTAQQAAQKNAAQTAASTLAFQLEGDAASLVNNALQTMAGQNLNVAQAQTAFAQSAHTLTDSLHQNGRAIDGNSTAALANQSALESNVSAARALMNAVAAQTHSSVAAIASYKGSKAALEAQLTATHNLTPAIQAMINRLYDVKGVGDYLNAHPIQPKVDTAQAQANTRALAADLAWIQANDRLSITVTASVAANLASTIASQLPPGVHLDGSYTPPAAAPTPLPRAAGHRSAAGQSNSAAGQFNFKGWTAVNESGNEMIDLPGGSKVIPSAEANRRLDNYWPHAKQVTPEAIRAALQGVALVIDAGSIGTLTGHIDARAHAATTAGINDLATARQYG